MCVKNSERTKCFDNSTVPTDVNKYRSDQLYTSGVPHATKRIQFRYLVMKTNVVENPWNQYQNWLYNNTVSLCLTFNMLIAKYCRKNLVIHSFLCEISTGSNWAHCQKKHVCQNTQRWMIWAKVLNQMVYSSFQQVSNLKTPKMLHTVPKHSAYADFTKCTWKCKKQAYSMFQVVRAENIHFIKHALLQRLKLSAKFLKSSKQKMAAENVV